jgi:phosphate transport system substrate-binding protein
VGSGAGVEKFLAEQVDFGATDAPLKAEERQKFPQSRQKLIQIPMTGGLVVFAYNLSNFEQKEALKLSRKSYCAIVTGKIRKWNDPQIMADNPQIQLPDLPIIFIHRADSSGTTFILTNHLQTVCSEWKSGAAKSVQWPPGFLAISKNEGVTAQIQQTQGAIGYIEYSYAKSNNITTATLENQAGKWIKPSPEAAAEAFVKADVKEDLALVIPDPVSVEAYPIVGLTWLLLYGSYDSAIQTKTLKSFITWSLTKGDKYAVQLGYLPLPNDLQKKVLTTLNNSIN